MDDKVPEAGQTLQVEQPDTLEISRRLIRQSQEVCKRSDQLIQEARKLLNCVPTIVAYQKLR